MDIITLQTKEQLDIFMNPQRQRLLRALQKSAAARTPKDLSLEIGVSASSVQHHLQRLESLGLVYVDHTAVIHGITAKYYAPAPVTVRIGGGGEGDELANERETLLRSLVADVLDDTLRGIFDGISEKRTADVLTGFVHLTPERAAELQALIYDFTRKYETPCDGSTPWEYAVVYRRTPVKP